MVSVTYLPTMNLSNLFSLEGRIALVTGSSKGIGLALAAALAAAGARVVLNARDPARLAQARNSLVAAGHHVDMASFDVTDAAAVQAGVEHIEKNIGAIDILVNNAGMQHRSPFTEFPLEAWRQLTATNVDSVFLVGQAVAQRMVTRRRGKIINVCSVQSELARPGIAPYTATKGAVKMLTKGMAVDLGGHGIQVNGLGPGYFKTELTQALVADEAFTAWLSKRTPAGRWGEVHELSGAAIFLASEASNFVNGHILYVDGGITAGL
jgi:gluconate 5-dehydrogenase